MIASLRRSALDVATELMREAILDGSLGPGQRLKSEELASRLGISRTPIREALLRLQAEGLVDWMPNRGAVVRSYRTETLEDLYEIRALLEGRAARRAVRAGPRLVGQLRRSCERFASRMEGNVKPLIKENLLFHEAILEAADSEMLSVLVHRVTELPLVYRAYAWYTEKEKQMALHYHEQLVKAFQSGDGERAESLMKEHILQARDVLLARLRDSGAQEGIRAS